jgi:hypothetical protein
MWVFVRRKQCAPMGSQEVGFQLEVHRTRLPCSIMRRREVFYCVGGMGRQGRSNGSEVTFLLENS